MVVFKMVCFAIDGDVVVIVVVLVACVVVDEDSDWFCHLWVEFSFELVSNCVCLGIVFG